MKIDKLSTEKSNLTLENQELKEKVDRLAFQVEHGKGLQMRLEEELKKS